MTKVIGGENMPDSPDELVAYIEKRILVAVGLMAITFLIGGYRSWALGIIVGGFASLIYFKSIVNVAEAVIGTTEHHARISTARSSALRQVLTLIILGCSFFMDGISFPAVVVGLLLVKIFIVTKAVQEKWQEGLNSQIKNVRRKLERRN